MVDFSLRDASVVVLHGVLSSMFLLVLAWSLTLLAVVLVLSAAVLLKVSWSALSWLMLVLSWESVIVDVDVVNAVAMIDVVVDTSSAF